MAGSGQRANGTPGVPRGVLLAIASATLTVSAHGMAGGGLPDSLDQVVFTALLTMLFAWGAGPMAGRGGVVRLLGVLAATQAAQHLLLTELAGHGALGGHGQAPVNGWVMLAAHTVAIAATAIMLSRADLAMSTIVSAIRLLLSQLFRYRVPPATGPVAAAPTSAAPARPGLLLEILLRRVSARRGPPANS